MPSKGLLYNKFDSELDLLLSEKSKIITISSGKRLLVDADFIQMPISINENKNYVEVLIKTNKTSRSLGRFLLDLDDPTLECDHINRNPLDNRKLNLRIATKRMNLLNREFINKARKYRGVSPHHGGHRVEIYAFNNCYRLYVNSQYDIDGAAQIFDCIGLKLNGEYQRTNFDRSNYTDKDINEVYEKFKDKIALRKKQPSKIKDKQFKITDF